MIYPKKLEKNMKIGISAPSDGANLETIDFAINNIKKYGYNVICTKSVRNSQGLVSADGKTRAKEFVDLLSDDKIGYIISARGGEFLMEMLPFLEEYDSKIKNFKPKWIQGYSDTSLLLYYITTKYNITTVHYENLGGFALLNDKMKKSGNIKQVINILEKCDTNFSFTQDSFEKYQIEEYENIAYRIENGYNLKYNVVYRNLYEKDNEEFSGRMLGGCIDVISSITNSKYDYTLKFLNECDDKIIWYLDNCELSPQELYRRLWNMKEAGYFKTASGFLIGRTYANSREYFTFDDAIKRALGDLHLPVILDVDIGHVSPQFVVINGAKATFKYKNNKGELIQYLN